MIVRRYSVFVLLLVIGLSCAKALGFQDMLGPVSGQAGVSALSTGLGEVSQDSGSDTGALGTVPLGGLNSGSIPVSADLSGNSDIASAQTQAVGQAGGTRERALLACTAKDYLVTPGDSYVLTFLRDSGSVTTSLSVKSDYSVNLGVFGVVSAKGMTFPDFRKFVEHQVSAAYPGSSPDLSFRSTGIFEVRIEGEVKKSALVEAWGLSRLSSLLDQTTAYASTRSVKVTHADGSVQTCDLFLSSRDGRLSEDPLLRPGDRVFFPRLSRSVTIKGEVRRPGTYQLLPSDTMGDLVQRYGDGLTPVADPSRVDLIRFVGATDPSGSRSTVAYPESAKAELEDGDIVSVPSLQALLPVVFFEGAVRPAASNTGSQPEPGISNRITYRFLSGETLANAVRSSKDKFTAEADLKLGYVLRSGIRIPVDLSRYLYDRNFEDRIVLEAGDMIVVPFKQYFVTVGGAVMLPGRYPYVPDRSWRYYVGLAGGANQERNSGNARVVYDAEGRQKSVDSAIEPEDSIVLKSNSFFYYLSKVSAILTPLASMVTIYLAIRPYLP